MDIKAMQAEVDAWIGQFKEGYFSPTTMILRLTEELGELAREVNHRNGEKPKKADEPPGSIALELGDMLFVLISFANAEGINLSDAFQAVMHKYRTRDAKRWTPKDDLKEV